jgi:hypothetical protein
MGYFARLRERLAKTVASCARARVLAMVEMKPGHMYLSRRLNHPACCVGCCGGGHVPVKVHRVAVAPLVRLCLGQTHFQLRENLFYFG